MSLKQCSNSVLKSKEKMKHCIHLVFTFLPLGKFFFFLVHSQVSSPFCHGSDPGNKSGQGTFEKLFWMKLFVLNLTPMSFFDHKYYGESGQDWFFCFSIGGRSHETFFNTIQAYEHWQSIQIFKQTSMVLNTVKPSKVPNWPKVTTENLTAS